MHFVLFSLGTPFDSPGNSVRLSMCQYCKKVIKNLGHLKEHILIKHEKKRNYHATNVSEVLEPQIRKQMSLGTYL